MPDHDDNHGSREQDPGRREFLRAGTVAACALVAGGLVAQPRRAAAQSAEKGLIRRAPSPWFQPVGRRELECTLCPVRCRIGPGRRGRCRVRENRNGTGQTLVYGNPCLVQIDPVERKPFYHVLPGTRALSVSTAGCPLECSFCEVWDMALVDPEDVHAYDLPPSTVVEHAQSMGARSVSYAFGEPIAFYEYVASTAALARDAGLLNLLHTSAYIEPDPLAEIVGLLDGVNVDLKSFEPSFYRDLVGGELEPVLRSLRHLRRAGVHIEITNLLIPTLNDDLAVIRRMAAWIRDELGPDTPLHFARFYPLYKLANLPPTPVSALDRAREVAREEGLRYVYVAKVMGHEGENTFCPSCGAKVIERLGFVIEEYHLRNGACAYCGAVIAGRWS